MSGGSFAFRAFFIEERFYYLNVSGLRPTSEKVFPGGTVDTAVTLPRRPRLQAVVQVVSSLGVISSVYSTKESVKIRDGEPFVFVL